VTLCSLFTQALADEPRTFACQGTLGNVRHWLTIRVDGGRVAEFKYISFTPQGHDCGFEAARRESGAVSGSEWRDEGTTARVKEYLVGGMDAYIGEVSIERKNNVYELRVVEQTAAACAVAAHIAKGIRLRPGKRRCEFPLKDRSFEANLAKEP